MGSVVGPVGSIGGTIIGGIMGGIKGRNMSTKFYQDLEDKMEAKRKEATEVGKKKESKAKVGRATTAAQLMSSSDSDS
jgi:phage tail tape-measure protein